MENNGTDFENLKNTAVIARPGVVKFLHTSVLEQLKIKKEIYRRAI